MRFANTATVAEKTETSETEAIARMNDCFRDLSILDESVGKWVLTLGINAKGEAFALACIQAIREYNDFNEDNDPYGDHSFGTVIVEDTPVWWKIDLYDRSYRFGAENPTDLSNTRRVLTVMLPSEY